MVADQRPYLEGNTMESRRRLAASPALGMQRAWLILTALALTLAASACSSRVSGSGSASSGTSQPTGSPAGPDKPKFGSDYERTCADGLGFAGLPAYSRAAKGVHPAVIMSKSKDVWTQQTPFSSDGYPSGWIVSYTDVARAELVVCYERVKATPAGKTCQMKERDSNEEFTLTMYNTQYRLRVLEARTGKVLFDRSAQARSTDCPTLTFSGSDDDRTKYYTDAQPRDYRGVLKPFIAP
jgi:hypothetical protein